MSGPERTVSVAVVYDSGSRGHPAVGGRTRMIAEAVARGAEAIDGTAVGLIPVAEREDHWQALDEADAIVFGCPTYMGSGSAELKAFMEETLHPRFLELRWKDKLAAGFTNSGGMSGDKLLSLQQPAGFAAQHGMIWVTLGQLPGWQTSSGSAEDENRLASFLGLMAQSNADQGPELVPPERPGDRRALRPAHRGGGLVALRGDHRAARRDAARVRVLAHVDVPAISRGHEPGASFMDGGDRVVSLFRHRTRSAGGKKADLPLGGLYEVRGGRVVEARVFHFDTAELSQFLE